MQLVHPWTELGMCEGVHMQPHASNNQACNTNLNLVISLSPNGLQIPNIESGMGLLTSIKLLLKITSLVEPQIASITLHCTDSIFWEKHYFLDNQKQPKRLGLMKDL